MTLEEFTNEFEAARPQLKSYILRITASVEDTEDIVQDTFPKRHKLRHFSSRKHCGRHVDFTNRIKYFKDNLRAKKRWPENVTDICREKALANPDYFPEIANLMQSSTHAAFEIKEHITFCLTCISKSLPLEQHLCMLLKEVYDFKVSEIAEILQTTEAMIKYYLHTSRAKMVHIYEGRCALINKEGTCHQCSELNGILFETKILRWRRIKLSLLKKQMTLTENCCLTFDLE
ncbi:MAG: RNA polymerase sigma factor [Bacteroidetes bacterium]|nr:RNA polymerase sigma factor [Bacteroidota bacterium]